MIATVLTDLIAQGTKITFASWATRLGNPFEDGHSAWINLESGVDIFVGFGRGHYGSNRYDSFDLATALLSAKTAELAVYRDGMNITQARSGNIGYGSTRKLRALVRKWA